MRCSYYRKQKKIINTETEEDNANYRILLDLKNHNWLLKKLKWQTDGSGKHLKSDSKELKMSEIIKIDDLENQIIEVDETLETEHENTSTLPASLPVQFFKKMSDGTFITKRDSHATSGYNIANMTPDPKDVEVVYNEITKEFNKTILKSDSSVHFGQNESKSELLTKLNNKQKVVQKNLNITAVRNIHNSEDIGNNNLNKVPKMDSFINENEKQTCIKHNLPLAAPPEREKYKFYKNKALVANSGMNIKSGNFFLCKDNYCDAETQTDGVLSLDNWERNFISFIKNNISVEQMKKNTGFIQRKDAATITENDSNMNENMKSDQVLIVLEACSFYNKELIALNSQRSENGSFPSTVDTYIKKLNIAYLRQAFETVLGSLFVELMKNCKEENIIDTNLPDVVPRPAEIRKRSVSVHVGPHSDSTNNEIPATVTQNVPMTKKPALRVRQKSKKQPKLTYPTMPQLQQYPHESEIVQPENTNYVNRHVPNHRNYTYNQQYQYNRTQTSQKEIPAENPLPFYNTGPRMMQPYSVQFTREQLTEYRNVSNTWSHPQRYPNVAQNLRPYLNVDPMSTRVLPTSGQQNYHYNQIQRNVVHNNNNNMPNYSGADWNM